MPKPWYSIKNAVTGSEFDEISILDPISPWYGCDAKTFLTDFRGLKASKVRLYISSPGGSVMEALAIFNGMRATNKHIEVHILGVAASAASYIAMAGHKIVMPSNTMMFLHNPINMVYGNADEMRANAGVEATITGVLIVQGGTSTIQFAALGSAVANTDTFIVDTGLFMVLGAGTLAVGSFRSYDPLTGTWTSLTITGLPATWGTDGAMNTTAGVSQFATDTATAGGATTLTNSVKAWAMNQWTNFQVRITAGLGIGQVRTIASNTGTVLTVSAAWTTNPDATSVYAIEANQDHLYLIGNNAVTMYRYSRSANTWTTMAPTTARAAAPGTGASLIWVGKTGDPNWGTENAHLDGRYLYSVRGGAGTAIDRFDIAGGTAGAGAWTHLTYSGAAETFTTGSSTGWSGRYLYIRKDATNRYFKFSVRGNYMEPLSTNVYLDGTALLGKKMWVKDYDGSGVLKWLYTLRNSATELHRLPLF